MDFLVVQKESDKEFVFFYFDLVEQELEPYFDEAPHLVSDSAITKFFEEYDPLFCAITDSHRNRLVVLLTDQEKMKKSYPLDSTTLLAEPFEDLNSVGEFYKEVEEKRKK